MPLLPPLSATEAGEAQGPLESLREKLGQVPNMYRTFAHAPLVLDAAVSMAKAVRTVLDAKTRELAYLKVVEITDCHVCRHYHVEHGRRAGLTDEQIRDLLPFEESAAYTGGQKDVLRFTEQWTLTGRVADDVLARLRAAFTPGQLVTLAATVAQANLTCRFNNVFGVELP
ncbi:carboxymuconolactone decarboxylase family protein [Urbifossiella limnaea]|uniref:Carboxymuconolactone decarboxylase family protein n=1 Tax=Urbifossiella limnaea TaxID=2528023 RepID=A0A517XV30_9BACT|nr:carboxymuconolactone decarboxylase family protein [Urbifossiella limnaea]QDU21371.1 Carboxymuconolactone decarboxylase family protein [Urbifossiella limnaea]